MTAAALVVWIDRRKVHSKLGSSGIPAWNVRAASSGRSAVAADGGVERGVRFAERSGDAFGLLAPGGKMASDFDRLLGLLCSK
jgi:hypothetical protein